MELRPCWDTFEKIAEFRAAVEAQYAKGRLTREEYGICQGNLDEAACLLRLRQNRAAE